MIVKPFIKPNLICRLLILPSMSRCPAEYCSITSFTSYGRRVSLNFRFATRNLRILHINNKYTNTHNDSKGQTCVLQSKDISEYAPCEMSTEHNTVSNTLVIVFIRTGYNTILKVIVTVCKTKSHLQFYWN